MSRLSEYLDYLLIQKNISKYVLAKKMGVDNSSFYKMVSGQRNISHNIFLQVLEYVPLTYEEKKELKNLYKMMAIGEEKYRRRQEILKFIQALNEEDGEIILWHKTDLQDISQGSINGRRNLSRMVSSLILSEADQGGRLKIICQTDFSFLYDTLKLINSKKPLEIEQIICFENSSKNRSIENIQALKIIAPLFRNSFSYNPYYFYGNTSSYHGGMSFLPFLILGKNIGILFSSDYESGLVFTETSILKYLSERFDSIKCRADSLLLSFERMTDAEQGLKKQKLFSDREIYVLCPNVFFSNNCDTEFWIKLLKEELPNRQAIINFMRKEGDRVKKKSSTNHVYSYFTKEGIMDFWNTGHVIDVLADYYKPVPKESRRIILQSVLEDIKSDRLEGRLFRKDVIQFSKDFYLIMQNENFINCIMRKKDGSFARLNFQERMLCEGMEDFLFSLDEEELLETKEETIQFLSELLR